MHGHQFEWLVSPEGLFWHSGTTTRALSLPGLQYIWTPPLPWNSFSHLEPVAEGETITCPCPQGLTLSQSLGANTSPYWSWDKKAPSDSQAANYCVRQLLTVHMCICSLLHTALPGTSSEGDAVLITCGSCLTSAGCEFPGKMSNTLTGSFVCIISFFILLLFDYALLTFCLSFNSFQWQIIGNKWSVIHQWTDTSTKAFNSISHSHLTPSVLPMVTSIRRDCTVKWP